MEPAKSELSGDYTGGYTLEISEQDWQLMWIQNSKNAKSKLPLIGGNYKSKLLAFNTSMEAMIDFMKENSSYSLSEIYSFRIDRFFSVYYKTLNRVRDIIAKQKEAEANRKR